MAPAAVTHGRQVALSLTEKVAKPSSFLPSWSGAKAVLPPAARNVLEGGEASIGHVHRAFFDETVERKLATALPDVAMDALAIQGAGYQSWLFEWRSDKKRS